MACSKLLRNTGKCRIYRRKRCFYVLKVVQIVCRIGVTFGRILWLRRLARSYCLGDSKLRKKAHVTKILLANGSNRWEIAKKSYRTPLKLLMRNWRKI